MWTFETVSKLSKGLFLILPNLLCTALVSFLSWYNQFWGGIYSEQLWGGEFSLFHKTEIFWSTIYFIWRAFWMKISLAMKPYKLKKYVTYFCSLGPSIFPAWSWHHFSSNFIYLIRVLPFTTSFPSSWSLLESNIHFIDEKYKVYRVYETCTGDLSWVWSQSPCIWESHISVTSISSIPMEDAMPL